MTWLVAGGYVGTAVLLGAALLARPGAGVLARLPLQRRGSSAWMPEILSWLGRPFRGWGSRTGERLRALGRTDSLERVLGMKALLAATGPAIGLVAWGIGPHAVVVGAALGGAGWVLPDAALARRVARRRERAATTVPELLDLVALAVGAGLSPRLALDRATSFTTGPLAEELGEAQSAVALGVPWETALRTVADRTGVPEVRRLAVTLARGKRLGTPLAEPLRRLALEVRAEQRARAEETARRAPVAMLFPLVLCILPAFVVAAVVPAVLVAIRGLG